MWYLESWLHLCSHGARIPQLLDLNMLKVETLVSVCTWQELERAGGAELA